MAIYLGNETISDLEKRTGFNFSEEDRKWLESHRQDNAEVSFESDKFHIFDMPFEIHASVKISDYLLKILNKYEEISPSKEQLQYAVIKETESQRNTRLEKERKQKEYNDRLANPNSIWNIKWHMLIPIKAKFTETGSEKDMYYRVFVNTFTTGYNNIPITIEGQASMYLDEEGFHGNFNLTDPKRDNDANKHNDWNYVIGCGFYDMSGIYLGHLDNITFEETKFSLLDAIHDYESILGKQTKEIHFDHENKGD